MKSKVVRGTPWKKMSVARLTSDRVDVDKSEIFLVKEQSSTSEWREVIKGDCEPVCTRYIFSEGMILKAIRLH